LLVLKSLLTLGRSLALSADPGIELSGKEHQALPDAEQRRALAGVVHGCCTLGKWKITG
jgi:hypothetical protein